MQESIFIGSFGNAEEVLSPEIPEGFRVSVVRSQYYGSHQEYDGEVYFFVVIPEMEEMPEMHLSHGSSSRNWDDFQKLPSSALIAEQWEDEWTTKDEFVHGYEL